MHIALLLKVTFFKFLKKILNEKKSFKNKKLKVILNPNFVEKKSYFILFFLESYFFDEQSKFLDVRFY